MSNFKSGSGNLDFGRDDEDEKDEKDEKESTQSNASAGTSTESVSSDETVVDESSVEESEPEQRSSTESNTKKTQSGKSTSTSPEYPYFVRRNNVGDERDTRLEIHVRDKVAQKEATFRSDIADHLGVTEISKTDAREFALLTAFQHPDKVAELMEEEGFGTLE